MEGQGGREGEEGTRKERVVHLPRVLFTHADKDERDRRG